MAVSFDGNGKWEDLLDVADWQYERYVTGRFPPGTEWYVRLDSSLQPGAEITSAATMPGSPHVKGRREWVHDGTNNHNGPWQINFDSPQNELWIRTYIRYQQGFSWASQSYDKLIRLSTGSGSGTFAPNIIYNMNGGSFKLDLEGQGTPHSWWSTDETWNQMFGGGSNSSHGNFVHVEMYVKMESSVGATDGVARLYMAGNLIATYTGMQFVNPSSSSIDQAFAIQGWRFLWHCNQASPGNGSAFYKDYDACVIYNQTPPNTDAHGNPYIGTLSAPVSNIIFQDGFENNPSNWVCANGQLSGWSSGWISCGYTDGFGYEWRMGTGRGGGNAVYSWKKSGVPNGYRSESNKWLSGGDLYSEVYHRWYMKVPPANLYNKDIPQGFKFWRYILRENGFSGPPEINLNVSHSSKFATGSITIYNSTSGYLSLTPISDFNDNEWHCHELRIKLNSNGSYDGVIQYWLDGTLKATHNDLSFSTATTNLAIHRFGVGVGNTSDPDWDQSEWSAIGFDDVVLSTSYVGTGETVDPVEPDPEPPPPDPDPEPSEDPIMSESFESGINNNRGWVDGAMTSIVAGGISGNCLRLHWQAGNSLPDNCTTIRYDLGVNCEEVHARFYTFYETGWRGSGSWMHSHFMHFLSDKDFTANQYGPLAHNWLNVYIEHRTDTSSPYNVYTGLAIQDSKRINTSEGSIPNNLTEVTENRATTHCNGCMSEGQDCGTHTDCYQSGGTWYTGFIWMLSGANHIIPKNQWVKREYYFKMNSIVGGAGIPDGIMRIWINNQLSFESESIVFRTGEDPTMAFRQFIFAPFIGGGSPITQTMYVDELAIWDQDIKGEIVEPADIHYEIEHGEVGGSYTVSQVNEKSYTQSNLTPNTPYEARVRKYDSGEYSNWSGWVQVNTINLSIESPAQMAVNFDDLSVNSNPIGNGWTARVGIPTESVIESIETPIGSKAWRLRVVLDQYPIEYTAGLSGKKIDVLILAKRSYAGMGLHTYGLGRYDNNVYKWYSGGFRNHNDGTDIRLVQWENDVWLYRLNTFHGMGNLEGIWTYVRTQYDPETNILRTKTWLPANAEPSWQLSGTYDFYTYPEGKMGLYTRGRADSSQQTIHVAYFSQGVGGAVAPMPDEPIIDLTTKVLAVGDDLTSGTGSLYSKANPTYRYYLYNYWYDNTLLNTVEFVGPYTGVGNNVEPLEVGGYNVWPQDKSYHAGIEGATISQLAGYIQGWANTYKPNIIFLLAWINQPTSITKSHFTSFIENARAGKLDVSFLIGLPYYGTYSNTLINQIRNYITEVRDEQYTNTSPIFLIDHNRRWTPDRHGYGYNETDIAMYPNITGNTRLAMRFQDGLFHYRSIGGYWTKPATPSLSVSVGNLLWDYDEKSDIYDIEYDGSVVNEQTATLYSMVDHTSGNFRVRGRRLI